MLAGVKLLKTLGCFLTLRHFGRLQVIGKARLPSPT
jgi:hypothetical protein